jgi:hypothetical protein
MNHTEITNQIHWPKMFPVLILRKVLATGFAILLMLPAMAQREKGESLITREQISKITELVKPLIAQLDKQLRDDETYKAYVRDITELNNSKNFDQKSALTKNINEKYRDFFQKVWAGANIDERAYQLRIKQVFPDDISKLIQFEPFLVFTLNVSTVTTPTPAEPPPPPDKCLDVCPMTTGEITGTGALIAGSGGSYGNCFLRTNAWSAGIGGNQLFGYLRNGITIPGTFPNDSRKLRVVKKYELMQEATSFAVLGGGYAETRARTFKTSEYMLVYSPVIFGASQIKVKSMSENYLLEKKDVAFSIFKTYAQTFSAFISGNWCYSNCFAIRWTLCEEK